jgi:hypothetical protein
MADREEVEEIGCFLGRLQSLSIDAQGMELGAEIDQAPRQLRLERLGLRVGERPEDLHRLPRDSQALFETIAALQQAAQIVEADGEIGEMGVGLIGGKPAAQLDCLLQRRECFLPTTEVAQLIAEVVEAGREVREKSFRIVPGQSAAQADRIAGGLLGRLETAHLGKPQAQVVKAEGVIREIGVGALFGQLAEVFRGSRVACSASFRRPNSLRRFPILLRPEARSGRKMAGRFAARRRRWSTASLATARASR